MNFSDYSVKYGAWAFVLALLLFVHLKFASSLHLQRLRVKVVCEKFWTNS